METAKKAVNKSGLPTGACITEEELDRAAKALLIERRGWMSIYREVGEHSPATWLAARKTERWEAACEPYETRKREIARKAWLGLEHLVDAGNFDAIKEALNRAEGSVEEKLDVNLHGSSAREELMRRLDTEPGPGDQTETPGSSE